MNLCDACEWCSTCLKRGECIPISNEPHPAPLTWPVIDEALIPEKTKEAN
jgi:hypothetical protein